MKKILKKETMLPILAIILGLIVVIGVSYAVFQVVVTGTKNNVINAGTLQLTFSDTTSNNINLTTGAPQTDKTGMTNPAYTFTIKNTGTLNAAYELKIEENQNLYTSHGDAGRIFPDNKLKIGLTKEGQTQYILYNRQVLDSGVLKPGESVTYDARIWIDYDAGNEVQGNHFHGKFTIEAVQKVYSNKAASVILANNTVKAPIDNMFSYTSEGKNSSGGAVNNTYVTNGLYKSEDEYGPSYYFRGNVNNNYVLFAGTFFRIIRINGDGTIRMIQDGISSINLGQYDNDSANHVRVGYSYNRNSSNTEESSSSAKNLVDNWYDSTIKNTTYEQYIATTRFCSDSSDYVSALPEYIHGSYGRLYHNKAPSLKCPNTPYNFGGRYNLNAGLITADEIAMAGGVYGIANNSMYLTSSSQWTMTPALTTMLSNYFSANVFLMTQDGVLTTDLVDQIYNINPVINLKATVTLTGTGTQADPYIVK